MTLVQTLFSFKGRLRRRDWWLWSIASAVAGLIASTIVSLIVFNDISALDVTYDGTASDRFGLALGLAILIQIPFLWVETALSAKRAHDRNRFAAPIVALTLFTSAVSYLPQGAATFAGRAADQGDVWGVVLIGAVLISGVASLYLLVVLGFLDGTPGPNRFGRSPKGIGDDLPGETARVFE